MDARGRPNAAVETRPHLGRSSTLRTTVLLLGVYAASRLLTTVLLAVAYRLATAAGRPIAQFEQQPDFVGFLQSWDGLNYREIALDGYPRELPRDADGDVQKNVWAFLPLYPMLVRAVTVVIPIDYGVAAILVSTVCGAGAVLVLHRVIETRLGSVAAFWGATIFCFAPLSFVLQVAYAESLFLLLMFAALWAILRRRYLLVIPLGIAAAFSHPGALALAATVGVVCGIRLLRGERMPRAELWAAALAVLLVSAAGFSWPFIVTAVTGTPDAYFLTELAWWRQHIGDVQLVPFTPSFLMASRYLGPAGVLLVIGVLATLTWVLVRRPSRVWGTGLLVYGASYLAYLLAVFLPQQSLFRLLLPLAPALGAPALTRTPIRRTLTIAACILLQPLAIHLLWVEQPP